MVRAAPSLAEDTAVVPAELEYLPEFLSSEEDAELIACIEAGERLTLFNRAITGRDFGGSPKFRSTGDYRARYTIRLVTAPPVGRSRIRTCSTAKLERSRHG